MTRKAGKRSKVGEYIYHRMVHYKGVVLKLRNIYTISLVLTRKAPKSWRIYVPSYAHYKESLLKLRSICTNVSSLQGKGPKVAEYIDHRMVITRTHLKVAEYIYHFMVITRKASQTCGIYIPSYGH